MTLTICGFESRFTFLDLSLSPDSKEYRRARRIASAGA